MAVVLLGCSTSPKGPPTVQGPSLTAQAIALPPFDLSAVAVGAAAGDLAADGRAHLLLRLEGSDEVQYLVVGPSGVERRTNLGAKEPGRLAIAFDDNGVLHAVIGPQHRSMSGEMWAQPQPGPPCERLVHAGRTLFCAYRENGSRFGTAGWRTDVYPLGMVPLPVPVPNEKVVLACLASKGWVDIAILDPTLSRDTLSLAIAGDGSGAVHLLYIWYRYLLLGPLSAVDSAWLPPAADCDERARAVTPSAITGETVFTSGGVSGSNFVFDVATDPRTGMSLNIGGLANDTRSMEYFLRNGGRIGARRFLEAADAREAIRHDARFIGPVRAGAAGDDHFHVLLADGKFGSHVSTLYHVGFHSGAWSVPLPIGDTRTWIMHNDAVQLITDGRGMALAIWPEGGNQISLRARWVTWPH